MFALVAADAVASTCQRGTETHHPPVPNIAEKASPGVGFVFICSLPATDRLFVRSQKQRVHSDSNSVLHEEMLNRVCLAQGWQKFSPMELSKHTAKTTQTRKDAISADSRALGAGDEFGTARDLGQARMI